MIPLGLWHCFGSSDDHVIDKDTALAMLEASGTGLVPINTHRRPYRLGHGDVLWDDVRDEEALAGLTPCLNINLRTSAATAVDTACEAREHTGIDLLKLEVLRPGHVTSDDKQVCHATRVLTDYGFRVMPLIGADMVTAVAVAGMGVPVIRVMGSPIGSGFGITWPGMIREIIGLGVPVVLDGGLGTVDDCREALELGCKGFLVNSMLFTDGDPVGALRELRAALEPEAAVAA